MSISSLFRKGDPKGEPSSSGSITENDPVGIQLKKWQAISEAVKQLVSDRDIVLDTDTTFVIGPNTHSHEEGGKGSSSREFHFDKGTIIKKYPEKVISSHVSGEVSGSIPEHVTIGKRTVEELADGTVAEVYHVMYIMTPDTQTFIDYTDSEHSGGKEIKNTNNTSFLGVKSLLIQLSRNREYRDWSALS